MSVNKQPLNAAQVLKQHGLRAAKGLGQNFLDDPAALLQIAAAADVHESDVVLEIGPGLGSLTHYLSISAGEVVAVELDRKLTPILRSLFEDQRNVRIVEGNVLKLSPGELRLPQGYIVAANIPYNITSSLFPHLLESEPKPRRVVLTVQKEVAERICASPPRMSLLSLSVQVYGEPSIVARIPASAFFPVPKVDSAVVKIEVFGDAAVPSELLSTFFRLIKGCFSQKRKTLRNALSAGARLSRTEAVVMLQQAGIDPQRRAETLDLREWKILSELWAARHQGSKSPGTT